MPKKSVSGPESVKTDHVGDAENYEQKPYRKSFQRYNKYIYCIIDMNDTHLYD